MPNKQPQHHIYDMITDMLEIVIKCYLSTNEVSSGESNKGTQGN